LARYPATKAIGQRFPDTEAPPAGGHGPLVTHARTPVDDETRIKASARLPNFPMFVLVTQTEAAALADWRNIAWTLGLITGACVISIVIATLATAHRWRHQQLVGLERAERAEEERARAMSDAELAHERERHAEEASRAKSDFLAMMSHEIRTPMNAVLGLAGTLLDTSLPPQQRRTVEAIRDSGDSLLRLLNDILDFSKLDAGRMTFEDMPFSPAALTRDTVSILGPRATAKGLAITATCAPSLPGTLLGDAGRIRQILLNLVSNAVKFTEAGAVSIEACCPERTSGSASIEWVVSDSGIGIAPDRMASLFGEFIQMDASIHRRFGGSGLGLAICKRLVDQMGGTIDATSCPGQGTVFRVRLKLSLSDQAAHEPPTPADVAAAFAALRQRLGRSPRVLFAEDNPTNQFVALQLLKGVDVQVNVVGDGLEAVDAASSFRYDAIFMDVRMPEMDGLDATRLIRKRGGALARIPIIALTANAFPEDVQACFAAGMDRFVPKPVTRDMLLSVLVSALTAQEPPAEPIPPPAGNPAAPATLDTAFLDEMVDSIGGDGVAEMVALFARETRDRLARLAVPIDDPNVLGREVHTLKGGARTVGASHLAELAAAAEARVKQGDMPSPTALAPLAEAFEIWLIAIQARIPEAARAA
jgi:signal transduction histidine kinase/CheY-like chemotaxis protein/HPt (histidine-containing phosphotransfer) domain-containing protein